MTANEVADVVMEKVLPDLPIEAGEEIAVMLNGLGGTPLEELFVVYNRIFPDPERKRNQGLYASYWRICYLHGNGWSVRFDHEVG